MKLYLMKQHILDELKANIQTIYTNYYKEETNQWLYDMFNEDPFEFFAECEYFELSLDMNSQSKWKLDVENTKLFYKHLDFLTESQASEERLWAGLCHSVFYDFCRKRTNMHTRLFEDFKKDVSFASIHYFLKPQMFRNMLSKYWWVAKLLVIENNDNPFVLLDKLVKSDYSTIVNDVFYSYTFTANKEILIGIVEAWDKFSTKYGISNVHDYLRPAIQALNARGGAVMLDILHKDEVAKIVYNRMRAVYKIKKKNKF